MAISKLCEKYKFMPLKRYISQGKKGGWGNKKPKRNILLSKIKDLDRDIVDQLEGMGIYDTNEFLSVQDELRHYLGVDNEHIQSLVTTIKKCENNIDIYPKINLTLKENFALVATVSNNKSNALALLTKKILMIWSNPINEGWNMVKFAFDTAFEKLDRPELLTSTLAEDIPAWIQADDLSVYISGLDPFLDLYKQSEMLGFPVNLSITDIEESVENKVLKLQYLLDIAIRNQD